MPTRTILSLFLVLFAAVSAAGAEITGERIFDRGNPRVEKVDKVLEAADAAAAADLKQAQTRHLRARVRNWTHAAEALAAEEAAAVRAGDSAGVAAVAMRRRGVLAKLEALKTQLQEETGEPAAPVSAAKPAGAIQVEKSVEVSKASESSVAAEHAASEPAADPEVPAEIILPGDVPTLMLGRWKLVEGDRTLGFVVLSSTGQARTYAFFGPTGIKDLVGGSWRVSNEGEVVLVSDRSGGNETFRVSLRSKAKAPGFRWSRKDESVPYRKGAAVELVRDGK